VNIVEYIVLKLIHINIFEACKL